MGSCSIHDRRRVALFPCSVLRRACLSHQKTRKHRLRKARSCKAFLAAQSPPSATICAHGWRINPLHNLKFEADSGFQPFSSKAAQSCGVERIFVQDFQLLLKFGSAWQLRLEVGISNSTNPLSPFHLRIAAFQALQASEHFKRFALIDCYEGNSIILNHKDWFLIFFDAVQCTFAKKLG